MDLIVRDSETVVERDRAAGKCSGNFDAQDRFGAALIHAKRFELEFVFLDRFRCPTSDVDLAMSHSIFIANNCVVGEAVHDCSHIVGVARGDVPLNDGRQIHLFVRDGGAGWAGKMDDFEALEADFAAPFFEIGGRIIERVAEFDQHV